jgi:hypothetical protein
MLTYYIKLYLVRFQVLAAASMKMIAFWDIAPCSFVEVDRRFRGCPELYFPKDVAGNEMRVSRP